MENIFVKFSTKARKIHRRRNNTIDFLVDNIFVEIGGNTFQQTVGIPWGQTALFCYQDGTCRFFGKGGMRTDTIPHRMMADLKAFGADAVFVHLGGNDIRQDSCPREIFSRLCAIEESLTEMGATVYIADIYRCGDFTKVSGHTEESFNKQRNAINRPLKRKYGTRAISIPLQYPADYDDRLVYFSDAGSRKYFVVVRRVFLRC